QQHDGDGEALHEPSRKVRVSRLRSCGSVSPSSAKAPSSGAQASLKLLDIADTQICRTGAFGDTTNLVSTGSSKTRFNTPFCSSTSKPSLSASGSRARRADSSASSLFTRNSCSDSAAIALLNLCRGPAV